MLHLLPVSSGTSYWETSTDADTSERNVTPVYQFTFLLYCAFLFTLSNLYIVNYLHEAHPGLKVAHPAAQEQQSFDHKCLKRR